MKTKSSTTLNQLRFALTELSTGLSLSCFLDDDGLSANWLDYFASFPKAQRLELVALKMQRDPNFNSGKFAEWNVGTLREHLLTESYEVRRYPRSQPSQ